MMDGITILAEEMIYCWPASVATVLVVSLILTFSGLLFSAIFSDINFLSVFFLAIGILSVITLGGAYVYGSMNEVPDYIKYKVLIDDEVNLNEFLNEYEILEQEGQIYSIKEIETVCD